MRIARQKELVKLRSLGEPVQKLQRRGFTPQRSLAKRLAFQALFKRVQGILRLLQVKQGNPKAQVRSRASRVFLGRFAKRLGSLLPVAKFFPTYGQVVVGD